MKPIMGRDYALRRLTLRSPRKTRIAGGILVVSCALLLLFLAWPYAVLWKIDQAVRAGDTESLADLVDLSSVRAQIKKKLNKDANSSIDEVSDAFIRWLAEGIGISGSQAVDLLVTVPWIRARLLDHSAGDGSNGFLGQVTYAFFDAPDSFVVRIGSADSTPVWLRLALHGLHWRICALYY